MQIGAQEHAAWFNSAACSIGSRRPMQRAGGGAIGIIEWRAEFCDAKKLLLGNFNQRRRWSGAAGKVRRKG